MQQTPYRSALTSVFTELQRRPGRRVVQDYGADDLDAALADLAAAVELLNEHSPERPGLVEAPDPHIVPRLPDVGLGL